MEEDVISGEYAGWRISMSILNGTATGFATNKTLDVTVELTPPVIRAWVDRIRTKFQRN